MTMSVRLMKSVKKFNITRERVRQIEAKAMRKIRRMLRDKRK